MATRSSSVAPEETDFSSEVLIEQAKRAFALKKYEEAVEIYAKVLEKITKDIPDDSPEIADLYFCYGKSLLENAISQNLVLGKEELGEGHKDKTQNQSTSSEEPFLSFFGDVEDDGDEAVNILGQEAPSNENDVEGINDEFAEPEDDFNAAWEVLDLARTIYSKQIEDDDEIKLKLADTYILLGDVSLETENFSQAIRDYDAGLSLKAHLLPFSSRHILEAHYKLSIVLDLTSGRLSDSIYHAEKAIESVDKRLVELRNELNKLSYHTPVVGSCLEKETAGKKLVRSDLIENMSKTEIEVEISEMTSVKEDIAIKVEELKTSPNEGSMPAHTLAAQQLDKDLNAAPFDLAAVNDLTSLVVKKKKALPGTVSGSVGKRKAESDTEVSADKKARIDKFIP